MSDQKSKSIIFRMRSAPIFTRSTSSGEAFLFLAISSRNFLAALPVNSGVGAIGVAITIQFKVKHSHSSPAGNPSYLRNVHRKSMKDKRFSQSPNISFFPLLGKLFLFFMSFELFLCPSIAIHVLHSTIFLFVSSISMNFLGNPKPGQGLGVGNSPK